MKYRYFGHRLFTRTGQRGAIRQHAPQTHPHSPEKEAKTQVKD